MNQKGESLNIVVRAIKHLREKNGVSSKHLIHFLKDVYGVTDLDITRQVKRTLTRGVDQGVLIEEDGFYWLNPSANAIKTKPNPDLYVAIARSAASRRPKSAAKRTRKKCPCNKRGRRQRGSSTRSYVKRRPTRSYIQRRSIKRKVAFRKGTRSRTVRQNKKQPRDDKKGHRPSSSSTISSNASTKIKPKGGPSEDKKTINDSKKENPKQEHKSPTIQDCERINLDEDKSDEENTIQ